MDGDEEQDERERAKPANEGVSSPDPAEGPRADGDDAPTPDPAAKVG